MPLGNVDLSIMSAITTGNYLYSRGELLKEKDIGCHNNRLTSGLAYPVETCAKLTT